MNVGLSAGHAPPIDNGHADGQRPLRLDCAMTHGPDPARGAARVDCDASPKGFPAVICGVKRNIQILPAILRGTLEGYVASRKKQTPADALSVTRGSMDDRVKPSQARPLRCFMHSGSAKPVAN